MNKKIINSVLIFTSIVVGVLIIFFLYWPFAKAYINEKNTVGDAVMHLANVTAIIRDHPFPIMAWKTEWAGYPLVSGYPWVHYYLIQPFLSHFVNPGVAIDYYSGVLLLFYYVIAFLLLYYISKNVFSSLLFAILIIYGADSQMPYTVNAFMTFACSQFFLPLILLITIFAREKGSMKLLLISSILLAVSFYTHGAMTGIIIVPIILPFLMLDPVSGKITKKTFTDTVKYFVVFAFISSVQVYQFIDYDSQGYLNGVKPFPLSVIPGRFINLMSWMNPALIAVLILFVPAFIFAVRKNFARVKPYLLSFVLILFIFTLMLFNITSMNLVLLAERVLWAITLSFLVLFSATLKELAGSTKKIIAVSAAFLLLTCGYLFLVLIVKPAHLVPNTLKAMDPYNYLPPEKPGNSSTSPGPVYSNKYEWLYNYTPSPWSKTFDNYRTDGISWAIYSSWNIWSSDSRYKGRFPAAKGLPLRWSGLVTASEFGMLGPAGTKDDSQWAINQTVFFNDWYAIKHQEVGKDDPELAAYFQNPPLITSQDVNGNLIYYNLDSKYVGPMYAPTNANTLAVVCPSEQYDNFIRTLSYSNFTSQKLIPIYLGSGLGSIKKDELKYYDSIFIYGYSESIFTSGEWQMLADYVKGGGHLIIETGQKVPETASTNLPEVFPVSSTEMEVVSNPWNLQVENDDLTNGVVAGDFAPFKTKYVPYAVSEAKVGNLKSWAKPVLVANGNAVMAYGQLGKGSVVWSGINLPFHAIDNRNTSETVIFANALSWFFPKAPDAVTNFSVTHPNPEKIMVASTEGKGFLIKENYDPGWRATLNGKNVKIYKAGLFEMYVPFDSSKGEESLKLSYYGTPVYWITFVIATVSLIIVAGYLFLNKNPLLLMNKIFKNKVKEKRKSEELDY